MPNLQVLRILRRNEGHFLNLCCEGGDYYALPGSISPTCHLVSQLRPRQIHLGDPDSGFIGTGAGLYTSTALFPPTWLEHIVLDIGCATEFFDFRSSSFLHAIPPTVTRLTFVLPTRRKDKRWEVVSGTDVPARAYNSWVKLAAVMTGQAQEMEIVGLELVDPSWRSLSAEQQREKAKAILVYCWVERNGLNEADARERAEGIRFTTEAEFKARQGATSLPDGARTITSGGMSFITYDE